MRRPLNELILTPLLAEVRMTEAVMNVTRFGSADLLPKRQCSIHQVSKETPAPHHPLLSRDPIFHANDLKVMEFRRRFRLFTPRHATPRLTPNSSMNAWQGRSISICQRKPDIWKLTTPSGVA